MTTPGQPLATAFVEVLPDFDKFTGRLLAGIEAEMLKLRALMQGQMRAIEGDVDRSFRNIGNTMTRESNKASRAVRGALNEVGRDLTKSVDLVNRGFREVANGAGIIGGVFDGGIGDSFKNLGKNASSLFDILSSGPSKFIAIGLALIPLLGLIATLGSVLANTVGVVGLLPTALSTLPALLAPVLIAFNGFGEALAAAFGDDPEKFKKALLGVTPAAQEIVKDLAALKKPFTDLRRQVQEAFFAPLVDDVDKFTANLFQPLQAGLIIVARQLGGLLSDVLGKLSSPGGAKFLQELFQTVADILASMRPAITALAVGFGKVAQAALPLFERLSGSFADVLTDFGNFLARAAADGSLNKFIEKGIEAFKELGALVGSVGNFLGSLFTDDAEKGGKAILQVLTDLFNKMAEFLDSPAGQDFLKFLIEDTKMFIGLLVALIASIGIVIVAITDFTGAILEAIKPIQDFVVGLEKDLLDFEKKAIDIIKGIPTAISDLASNFASAGKGLIDAFIGGFRKTGDFIGDVAGDILGGIKGGLNKLIGGINSGIAKLDAVLPFVELPRLNLLAQGGLALGPAILGEAGPELALPLNNPTAQEAIRQALGGSAGGVTVAAGAVQVVFQGVVPSREEAFNVGRAVLDGMEEELRRRDGRTLARLT